jgi:hypothetical protein
LPRFWNGAYDFSKTCEESGILESKAEALNNPRDFFDKLKRRLNAAFCCRKPYFYSGRLPEKEWQMLDKTNVSAAFAAETCLFGQSVRQLRNR